MNLGYRITTQELFDSLAAWDQWMGGRGGIHLIACGGTALTLLGYKDSTKDVDLLVPDLKEYERLLRFLKKAGYQETTAHGWQRPGETFIFDLFPGKRVYVTELLTSPLAQGGHRKIREWKRLYLGVLNSIDLIISKLFRGQSEDWEDCLVLVKREGVDPDKLKRRYLKTASYDASEDRLLKNLDRFLRGLEARKLV